MSRLKNQLIAIVLFVTLELLWMSIGSRETEAQNPRPATPVDIVSPLPVPVTVTGALAIAPGNSVDIGNSATNPVPVRDVANPARNRFQTFTRFAINDGAQGGSANFDPVPVGKRFVIEYASVLAEVPKGQSVEAHLLVSNIGDVDFFQYMPTVFQGVNNFVSLQDRWVAGLQVRIYSEGGFRTLCVVNRAGPNGEQTGRADINCAISGYLVDVP